MKPATATTNTPSAPDAALPNQFALLRQRRFAPYFWTQFLGAANDNLFKIGLVIWVTYQVQVSWLPSAMAGLVVAAILILPFLLFSASSGQLADRWPKDRLMRSVKTLEIGIMLLAWVGFEWAQVGILLACIFLMGLHSTVFGPAKYAYLPQVLSDAELAGGTGVVEMGTFVAILLGQIAGGLLITVPDIGPRCVAIACLTVALAGRVCASHIDPLPATDPQLRFNWNPFTETWRNLQKSRGDRPVFLALLGISWMWFFGAVFLSQYPTLARDLLHGDAHVASLVLVVFSVGLGLGSLLCEILNRRHLEIGLVPLGALGMTVFCLDLYPALNHIAALPATAGPAPNGNTLDIGQFLALPANWRVLIDMGLVSLFTGLFSVPLYTLIQLRSPATHRSRVVAANNILNALFMIASSVIGGALLGAGIGLGRFIGLTGIANALFTTALFVRQPVYLARCVAWLMCRLSPPMEATDADRRNVAQADSLHCPCLTALDAARLTVLTARSLCIVKPRSQPCQETPTQWHSRAFSGLFWRLTGAIDHPASAAALRRVRQQCDEGRLLCLVGASSTAGGLTDWQQNLLQQLGPQSVESRHYQIRIDTETPANAGLGRVRHRAEITRVSGFF